MHHPPQPTPRKTAPALTVSIEPARIGQADAQIGATGNIAAIDPLTIGSVATGLQIISVPVDEGTYVSKGQTLAVLDSSLLRAQLAAARARLAGAQASTAKAIQPNRPEDIASARQAFEQAQAQVEQAAASVSQAQANYENAERTAQRYRGLVQQGAVSQQDADNQINAARTALAQLQAARASLNAFKLATNQMHEKLLIAQQGGTHQDIAIARANAADIAAQVEQLNVQIAQTVVRAPDDGLITKRSAHIGDIVSVGKSLFEMTRKGQLELQAQITQQDLSSVKVGQPAQVTDGIRTASGAIWQISPQVDAATRLAVARISLPLKSGFLPGMFARAQIKTGTRQVLLVPDASIVSDGSNNYVFLYDNGVARKRQVQVGEHIGGTTQINDGLRAGDVVIANGAGFLNDGDAVRVSR